MLYLFYPLVYNDLRQVLLVTLQYSFCLHGQTYFYVHMNALLICIDFSLPGY